MILMGSICVLIAIIIKFYIKNSPREYGFLDTWTVEKYRRGLAAGSATRGRASGQVMLVTGAGQGVGKEIAEGHGGRSIDGAPRYAGTCRGGLQPGQSPRAWRLRLPDREVSFEDGLLGWVGHNLERDVGDIVLLRADGQYAYQQIGRAHV